MDAALRKFKDFKEDNDMEFSLDEGEYCGKCEPRFLTQQDYCRLHKQMDYLHLLTRALMYRANKLPATPECDIITDCIDSVACVTNDLQFFLSQFKKNQKDSTSFHFVKESDSDPCFEKLEKNIHANTIAHLNLG